jgi:N-acetyl-gamma-glutamyl-phosphate reductase
MTVTVFIDGEAGTTGLQIVQRLAARKDVHLMHLNVAERKDPQRRAAMLNEADLSILCLPDDAARESVAMIESPWARVIDASTAHRTAPGWVYGFPEYDAGQPAKIKASKRVANTGCYAVSMVSLVWPLVKGGLLPADYPVTVNAVSGYSGGGKSLISAFEDPKSNNAADNNFYLYGLGLEHKHIKEMQVYGGLTQRPLFVPSVGRFAQGMIVSLPLQLWSLPGVLKPSQLHACLADHYAGAGSRVTVADLAESDRLVGHLDAEALAGADGMTLYVFGNENREQAVLCAVLDNLGKGASGQAVQLMDLMLGMG